MRAIQSFVRRSSMSTANRETAETERPILNTEALTREERSQCRCALGVANLRDDAAPPAFVVLAEFDGDLCWGRVSDSLQARAHANSCRPLCRSDGMAVTRGIFNLLMETAITRPPRGNFWETVDLVLRDGQPYARLRVVESDLEEQPNRPAHPTTVHALLTTKSGASWRVDMTPTLRYYDRWMRRIPPSHTPWRLVRNGKRRPSCATCSRHSIHLTTFA